MENSIKTTHRNFSRYFYFILEEKVGAVWFFLWGIFLALGLYFVIDNFSQDSTNPMIKPVMLGSVVLVMITVLSIIALMYVWPAYIRAHFLRNEGYCIITSDHIEAHCLGKIKNYEYKDLSIKSKCYNDGSTDIFIGKSFRDLIIHSGFLFSSKFFKANRAARGFGAPLYAVTNPGEVLEFLGAHK